MVNLYNEAFERSINDPNGFWGEVAENCHWLRNGPGSWTTPISLFTGGLSEVRLTPATMPWISTLKTAEESRLPLSTTALLPIRSRNSPIWNCGIMPPPSQVP